MNMTYRIIISRQSAALFLQKEYGTQRANAMLKNMQKAKEGFWVLPDIVCGKLKTKKIALTLAEKVKMTVFYQQGKLGKNLTDACVYLIG